MNGLPAVFLVFFCFLVLEAVLRARQRRQRLHEMLGDPPAGRFAAVADWILARETPGRLLTRLQVSLEVLGKTSRAASRRQALLLVAVLGGALGVLGLLLVFRGAAPGEVLLRMGGALALCAGILAGLVSRGRWRFRQELPRIYRLLSSRYLVGGDMLAAIELTLPDLAPGCREAMHTAREALLLNDGERRDKILSELMARFDEEYFTLLLYMIRQGTEKGGQQAILEQFVEVTEECLLEIEYRKEVGMAARSYTLLILLVVLLMGGVTLFNLRVLGEPSMVFYSAPEARLFQGAYLLMGLLSVWLIRFMERTFQ